MSSSIPVRSEFLERYLEVAPSALALERALECQLLAEKDFKRPVLDIGCGEGLFAKILFREAIDTGIDPNPRELERARKLASYRELIQCFGDRIPKPDGHFQTALSNSVLEHIPDLPPVLKEIHRVLALNGVFYCTVPSNHFEEYTFASQFLISLGCRSLAMRYQRRFNKFWSHFTAVDLPTWTDAFERNGFHVDEAHYYGSKKSCMLNDCMAPFGLPSFVLKRIANRWTILPPVRRFFFMPFLPFFRSVIKQSLNIQDGGLVLIVARKLP